MSLARSTVNVGGYYNLSNRMKQKQKKIKKSDNKKKMKKERKKYFHSFAHKNCSSIRQTPSTAEHRTPTFRASSSTYYACVLLSLIVLLWETTNNKYNTCIDDAWSMPKWKLTLTTISRILNLPLSFNLISFSSLLNDLKYQMTKYEINEFLVNCFFFLSKNDCAKRTFLVLWIIVRIVRQMNVFLFSIFFGIVLYRSFDFRNIWDESFQSMRRIRFHWKISYFFLIFEICWLE